MEQWVTGFGRDEESQGMRVQVIDRTGYLKQEDQQALERRLLFQLTRYGTQICRVRLEFDEQPGTRKQPGANQWMFRCRGLITMQDERRVQVDDRDDEFCRCGFRVADRLSRSIARLIQPRVFHRSSVLMS